MDLKYMDLKYKVNMLSCWHCGSGLSGGSEPDLLVIKDQNNLPYIPGKTIKGLLREQALYLSKFNNGQNPNQWKEFITNCFGRASEDKTKKLPTKGECFFSNAHLTRELSKNLCEDEKKMRALYRKISSTSIGENGVAKDKTLRKIEVTIPLFLFGCIYNLDNKYTDKMKKCIKAIKRLGISRNRGYGRCKWEIREG